MSEQALFDPCEACGGRGRTPGAYGEVMCKACKGTGAAEPDGQTYDRGQDQPRLKGQTRAVFKVLQDRQWHQLEEIAAKLLSEHDLKASTQSVSARIRDLRKEKFGSHEIERRRAGSGLFEYRLVH